MRQLRFAVHLLTGLSVLAAAHVAAARDTYPARPIKIIVGYPAGGANDIVARSIGKALSLDLGQSVVVENISGGAGSIGAGMAAKAAPDGYTLFMAAGAHALAPSLRKSLPYDMVKSFQPISLAAVGTYVLTVNPAVKAKSVAELIALAKANPGKLNFASSGVGAPPFLAAVLFEKMTGVKMSHIPYRGDSDANTALLAGQVDMYFASLGPTLPLIQAGRLRALAITSGKRSPLVPKLPTLNELGLKGYNVETWWGLVAPAGTPEAIVRRLAASVAKATHSGPQKAQFAKLGIEARSDTPQQFAEFIKHQVADFAKLAKAAGIEPQ